MYCIHDAELEVSEGCCYSTLRKSDHGADLVTIPCRTKLGKGVFQGILGMRPAEQPGVEDMNFSWLVRSHGDWCKHSDRVLGLLGLTDPAADSKS